LILFGYCTLLDELFKRQSGSRLTSSFIVLVIDQLFGLNPLAVLTSIAGMLRLIPVREYVVFADEVIL
jgi:hypothetical protein